MNLIDQLKHEEAIQNNGRGVSCVRTIIKYLECGHYHDAETVAFNENDKIANYPNIVRILIQLFTEKYKSMALKYNPKLKVDVND